MKFSSSLSALLLASMALTASADDLTRWDFNGPTATTVPGGTSSPTPSVGSGSARVVGGVTAPSFNSASADGGSSDPATAPNDFGWQTSSYPAASAADESAGVEFSVSTVGWEDIVISYDVRHSNTSSRYESVQYSIDGVTFTTYQYFTGAAGDTWFNHREVDLSGIAGVENNPNFKFRIVAAFEATAQGSGAPNYVASATSYATTGTWRFDYVNVAATAVPETSSALLALLGSTLALRRRR